jgi:hydroxypyruvate reductase
LLHVIQAALDGVSAPRVIARALADAGTAARLSARPIHLVAAGKAAPAMATALMSTPSLRVRTALAIGSHPVAGMPASLEFLQGSHPFPDAASRAAARAALARARSVSSEEQLVLLISGGASALMAEAADGLSFDDKLAATRAFMLAGADIHQLNALRKHLSLVKGGWLAAACAGLTTTLALSDVIGDDLSVIGSGPGWPDASTWNDVARALEARGATASMPAAVLGRVAAGLKGDVSDTPKPGDPRLARVEGLVVGRAADAVAAAASAAERLGYAAVVLPERVTGEAREAAPQWLTRALARARQREGPVCVLSSGETTVTVRGAGVGGRNLEFALALATPMSSVPNAVAASIGTDGIDGMTDVAGARVDAGTLLRAATRGLPSPGEVLAHNDSFHFFSPLGDTLRTGRTDTNVGDLQVLLLNQ